MNKKYLSHLLKTHKILFLVQVLICMFAFPFTLIKSMNLGVGNNGVLSINNDMTYIRILMLISAIGYAFFISIKYYRTRSIDVYDSLPLAKEKRKLIEVLFGWFMFAIPYIIGALIVMVYVAIYKSSVTFNAFVSTSTMTFLACTLIYMFIVFLLSICSSLKEGIINVTMFIIISSYAYIAVIMFMSTCSLNWFPLQGTSEIFRSLTYLVFLVSPALFLTMPMAMPLGEMTLNEAMICVVLIITIILFVYLVYRFSKNRKAEYAGMKHKCLPLYFIALGIGSFLLGLTFMSSYGNSIEVWFSSQVFVWIALVIAILIYDRSKKMVLLSLITILIAYVGSIGFQYGMVQTEFFGQYRSYKHVTEDLVIRVRIFSFDSDEAKNVEITALQKDKDFKQMVENMQDEFVDDFKVDKLKLGGGTKTNNQTGGIYVEYGEGAMYSVANSETYRYIVSVESLEKWYKIFKDAGYSINPMN